MKPRHVVAVICGSMLSLLGLGLLAGGGTLGWAYGTQRDDNGYFNTSTHRFTTASYAITSDKIDMRTAPGPRDWSNDSGKLAKVRINAKGSNGLFVGIGPVADVERYLANVAHDEVTRIDSKPFRAVYRRSPGTSTPITPPNAQSFWVAKATGTRVDQLTWNPHSGAWAVVVMNGNATPGVLADINLGIRLSFLGWLIAGLVIAGLVAAAFGATLIVIGMVRGTRSRSTTSETTSETQTFGAAGVTPASGGVAASSRAQSRQSPDATSAAGSVQPSFLNDSDQGPVSTYPLRLEARLDPNLSRWLWLVKWILLIPHFIVLFFLWFAFVCSTVVAGFVILFTGRYPRSLFDFNVGVLRWSWRVQYYGTSALGTDQYPPFSLEPSDDYPASLDVDYPQHLSRGLVLVKSWLLAIPHLLIVGLFSTSFVGARQVGGDRWRNVSLSAGGLIGVCVCIAGVVLLFTGRYMKGLFDFIMGMNRWCYRVIAYVALMTDRYPPFHFDGGGTESSASLRLPPPSPPKGTRIDSRGGLGMKH